METISNVGIGHIPGNEVLDHFLSIFNNRFVRRLTGGYFANEFAWNGWPKEAAERNHKYYPQKYPVYRTVEKYY